jgi:hypothetical protein
VEYEVSMTVSSGGSQMPWREGLHTYKARSLIDVSIGENEVSSGTALEIENRESLESRGSREVSGGSSVPTGSYFLPAPNPTSLAPSPSFSTSLTPHSSLISHQSPSSTRSAAVKVCVILRACSELGTVIGDCPFIFQPR